MSGMSLPVWPRWCVSGLVTIFRMGGLILAARSVRPSTMACRTGPSKRTCVPILIEYTGIPTSVQIRWSCFSAASALLSMMVSVLRAVSELSCVCAWRKTALVSSGIFLSDRSYRVAVTFLINSLLMVMSRGSCEYGNPDPEDAMTGHISQVNISQFSPCEMIQCELDSPANRRQGAASSTASNASLKAWTRSNWTQCPAASTSLRPLKSPACCSTGPSPSMRPR